jgi:hypothetical protein
VSSPIGAPFWHFPDVQRLLVLGLEPMFGAGHTDIRTPADFTDLLPFCRVRRTGGGSTRLNDHPVVDVDVFAALYDDAVLYAAAVREFLVGPAPGIRRVDACRCDPGPRELPWGDDTSVRRIGATYHLTLRRALS